MQLNQDLRRDLSASFNLKLAGVVSPGESTIVSLPGAYGEALVVLNSRMIVLREMTPSIGKDDGIEAYSYPLRDITGVSVTNTTTGGVFVIEGTNMPQEMEKHSVFFPTYDLDRFNKARDAVMEMLENAQTPTAPAPAASTESSLPAGIGQANTAECCPKCGSAVSDKALFCSNCSEPVGFTCDFCFSRIRKGAHYCPGCGNEAVDSSSCCSGCGRAIPHPDHGYCPWCGIRLGNNCFACGSPISKSWVFCMQCGRKLGSDEDARTMQELYSRRTNTPATGVDIADAIPRTKEPPKDPEAPSTAARYNDEGKALFDKDDVDGAIEKFQMAVELDPNNSAYHCNLAVAYDDAERDDEAMDEYRKTLDIDPNDTTALLYIGYIYSERDDKASASRVWNRLIQVAPGSSEAQEAGDNLSHQGEL